VTRVLLIWNRPYHLSMAEAEAWTVAEVRRLTAVPGVRAVALARVTGGERHLRAGDWLCELKLHAGADGLHCLEHPACLEWLLDLRLLGMRPAVAVLDRTQELR
jgi:hypothetical protein